MSLTDLEIKLKEELIRSERWNRWSNLIKSLGSFAIAIAIFFAISLPQFRLSKEDARRNEEQSKRNKEMAVKERASFVIDVLKEREPEIRNNLIFALRDFYPEVDTIFLNISNEIRIQAKNEWQIKLEKWEKELEKCDDNQKRKNIEMNIELCKQKIKELI